MRDPTPILAAIFFVATQACDIPEETDGDGDIDAHADADADVDADADTEVDTDQELPLCERLGLDEVAFIDAEDDATLMAVAADVTVPTRRGD